MARYGMEYGPGPRGWRGDPAGGRGRRAVPLEGYGYGFRRGYDAAGGFGPSGPRARGGTSGDAGYGVRRWRDPRPRGGPYDHGYGREMPAWPGDLRVSRHHGRGYGRG